MKKAGTGYKKKCAICGTNYIAQKENGKFCSYECKKAHMRIYDKERRAKQKAQQEKSATKSKKVDKNLASVSAKAREAGMSYGQYVALKMAGGAK